MKKSKRNKQVNIRLTETEYLTLMEIVKWRKAMGLKSDSTTDVIVAMINNYANKIKPYQAMLRTGVEPKEVKKIIDNRYKNQVQEELQRERDKQSTIKFNLDKDINDLPF